MTVLGTAGPRQAARQLTESIRLDSPEVDELLRSPWFDDRLRSLAEQLDREPASVREEAVGYLWEMAATHQPRATNAWRAFGRWFLRAYDVYVDDGQVQRLRELDRHSSLAFAFSHRSYLDGFIVPEVVAAKRLTPAYTLGGSNLRLFPFGSWASRSGVVFIRRNIRELPVYRLALRSYIAELVRSRGNLAWSIEGGRTGPASCAHRSSASCAIWSTAWTRSPGPATRRGPPAPTSSWSASRSSTTSCTRCR